MSKQKVIVVEDLLKDIELTCGDYSEHGPRAYDKVAVKVAVKSAPTLEISFGKWIPQYHTYTNGFDTVQIADKFHCSECNILSKNNSNYCPNCGAKMEVSSV